jgi:phosphoserine phosphatase
MHDESAGSTRLVDAPWPAELPATLAVALESALSQDTGRRVAAFDFDNTTISGDFGAQLHLELSRGLHYAFDRSPGVWEALERCAEFERLEATWSAWRAFGDHADADALAADVAATFTRMLARHGAEATYRWAVTLHAGQSEAEVEALAARVWGRLLEAPREPVRLEAPDGTVLQWRHGLRRRPAIEALFRWLGDRGCEVWLVSLTHVWALRAACGAIGVRPDRCIGQASEAPGGVVSTRFVEPGTLGAGKVQSIERATGRRPLVAAGDSANDHPMLEASEVAIWIDHGDDEARRHAESRGWHIVPAARLDVGAGV